MAVGNYELVFDVAAYFAAPPACPRPTRLSGRHALRFGIADTAAHYHVPLLVSPWSYSTLPEAA